MNPDPHIKRLHALGSKKEYIFFCLRRLERAPAKTTVWHAQLSCTVLYLSAIKQSICFRIVRPGGICQERPTV